jgi:hypothetical protein
MPALFPLLKASCTIEPTSESDRSNCEFPHAGQRINSSLGDSFPTAARIFFMDVGVLCEPEE